MAHEISRAFASGPLDSEDCIGQADSEDGGVRQDRKTRLTSGIDWHSLHTRSMATGNGKLARKVLSCSVFFYHPEVKWTTCPHSLMSPIHNFLAQNQSWINRRTMV
jgi:hypothetical protein